MTPPTELNHILRTLRRRMVAQVFVRALARYVLAAEGLLVTAGLVKLLTGKATGDLRIAAFLLVLSISAALISSVRARPTLPRMAAMIDRHGQTLDRFVTALELAESDRVSSSGMDALALRECRTYLNSQSFSLLLRWRIPRELQWLPVPMVALALLQWNSRITDGDRRAKIAAGQAEVARTLHGLEALARATEKARDRSPSEQLERIAGELKRGTAQLRADATGREEARKAAMRELSSLEDLVKQMRDQPAPLTAEEKEALAKALEQNDATREAANALSQGDTEKAAKSLEEAAKQLAGKDPESSAQAEQALKQALDQLAGQKALSQALQKLTEPSARQGEQPGSSQLLEKLAQLLRQTPEGKQSAADASGQSTTQQTLQQLLAAIENMKYGDGQTGDEKAQVAVPSTDTGSPEGKEATLAQAFGQSKREDSSLLLNPELPSGRPGTEHDIGTTDSPFGKRVDPTSAKGGEMVLSGQLGKGESLSQFLPTAQDGSKSNRRYKELYEAMAPAAQDAVTQENIPLGSRFFIKRYFESIRPKE